MSKVDMSKAVIKPSIEELKKLDTKLYDIAPVSTEILSDFITPVEALRIFKNVSSHTYMLESAEANETWGRYTFLGFDPKLEITCLEGELKIGDETIKTDDPSSHIRKIMKDYRSPRFDYLPTFTGGLVGYFSYDYIKYSEPVLRREVKDENEFKDVDLMLFDKVIAFSPVLRSSASEARSCTALS